MTPHPIPKYLSKPALYFLTSTLIIALFFPAPFAIISPGPVTDLLSKGISLSKNIDGKANNNSKEKIAGKLFSLSVFVNNPESRPPGILVLAAWLSGDSVVLPYEVVYEAGETTKTADAKGKKDMKNSEELAAIAAANFLKNLDPTKPLNWKASDIKFVMKNVGGPSAGLAFALALIARLQDPQLIAGRKIAVTGTITQTGVVGRIGGIDQKLVSARNAGAVIAVIPRSNCEDITIKSDGLQLIAVNNLSEAFHGLVSPEIASTLRCPA